MCPEYSHVAGRTSVGERSNGAAIDGGLESWGRRGPSAGAARIAQSGPFRDVPFASCSPQLGLSQLSEDGVLPTPIANPFPYLIYVRRRLAAYGSQAAAERGLGRSSW